MTAPDASTTARPTTAAPTTATSTTATSTTAQVTTAHVTTAPAAGEVVGRVVAVRAFPVKSMDAAPLERARVLGTGVEHDRRWAVVDAEGAVVTAKRADALRSVVARADGDRVVVLLPGGTAAVHGPEADAALSALVGRPVTLGAGAAGGYNEVAPLHLVSTQAIARGADHDDHGGQCPCSVQEPRANLVLDLDPDGDLETGWLGSTLRVGAAVLRVSKAPRHCLGVYAEVLVEGEVALGDEVLRQRD